MQQGRPALPLSPRSMSSFAALLSAEFLHYFLRKVVLIW